MGAPAQGFSGDSPERKNEENRKTLEQEVKITLLHEQNRRLNTLIAHLQIITDEEGIDDEGELDGSF